MAEAESLLSTDPGNSASVFYQLLNTIMHEDCADSMVAGVVDGYRQAIALSLPKDSVYSRMIQLNDQADLTGNVSVSYQSSLWLAQAYLDDGNFFLARKYAEEALDKVPAITDAYQKARAYNVFGCLLGFVGELDQAQENLLTSYKLFEENGDYKALSAVCINMANNYFSLTDTLKALEYYRKARRTSLQHHDTLNYLISLSSLGRLHAVTNSDSAYYYFKKAIDLGSSKWMIETLATRFEYANFLVEQKLNDSAYVIYTAVMEVCRQNGIDGGVYRAMSGLGNVLEARGLDEQALEMYQQARMLAAKAGETPLVIGMMNAERYMYEKMGNYKQGYKIALRIKAMSDSLFSLEKQLRVHDLEMFYQNEKANLRNLELQLNVREMERRNFTVKVFLVVASVGLITLTVFLLVFYRLYRQRDMAYVALFEKYKHDTTNLLTEVALLKPLDKAQVVESNMRKLMQEIELYFAESKPYLNCSLKIEEVAQKLGVSQKQVSATLKASYGLHFNVFVNKYRIQEALKLLARPDYQNIKIEHIAKEVGFGSKVSFYNAFAQVTGSNPSDYRRF